MECEDNEQGFQHCPAMEDIEGDIQEVLDDNELHMSYFLPVLEDESKSESEEN